MDARIQQFSFPAGEGRDSLQELHRLLIEHLPADRIAIYEAGGGSTSYLPQAITERATVAVVDIDEVQIDNNRYADTKILGDVQTYRFSPGSIDLVICYNVIEHLPDVEAALLCFRASLKKGGLIFIGAPNPASLSGAVTRYSPHWFHVWYYRTILGRKEAGQPGQPPFPTFFHRLVDPSALRSFMERNGFEAVYYRAYESPRYTDMAERHPLLGAVLKLVTEGLNLVVGRGRNVRHGDFHVLLRKVVDS